MNTDDRCLALHRNDIIAYAETKPVQPNFDVNAAKESINQMIREGGYYQPVGGSIEAEFEIAGTVADKIRETNGKKYSTRDMDAKYSTRKGVEFVEDKYYSDLIRRFEDQKHGGYIKVGKILEGSILHEVGLPVAELTFDSSKIARTLSKHEGSQITKEILQQVPEMLRNPVVITEDEDPGNINVFGDVWINNSPVLVGIVITQTPSGKNVINKIRTVHPKRNAAEKISDRTVLFLDDDKKRTRNWFLTLGTHLPLGGTTFGFIRSIAQTPPSVNQKLSIRTDNLSDREILANSFEGIAANDNERKYIAQYRTQIDELYKRQQRLAELHDELKREKKVKEPDKARIAKLNTEINAIADLVNRADKRLLAFEKAKPLQDVLARERKSSERTH